MKGIQSVLAFIRSLITNPADFIVYAAIAVVTLIGVFRCLIPLINARRSLRRAITRLQNDAGVNTGAKPVWQGSLFVGKRLRTAWLRFLQNAEQLDRRGLPCNVEDYINDDTVVHGPGNATLAELIPGLLTSLGILGTFMGMVSGLSGFSMENPDAIMNGIPVLLEGMRFAFGTSVAGISCSLVFNMLNRILQGAGYRAVDEFVASFTQLAMSRPLDNDVQLICQNQDRNHMLSNVTDGLVDRMAENIEFSVTRAMSPVARTMDNFISAATRAQVDGIGRIVELFLKEMNNSLDNQFLMLGKTLVEINQRQQISAESAEAAIQTAMKTMEDTRRLQGISQEVLTRFESYISEISFARQRDTNFERDASVLLDRMNASSGAISDMIARQNENMKKLESAAGDLAGGTDMLGTSCQDFVTGAVDGLSHSLAAFESNTKDMVRLLSEKIDTMENSGTDGSVSAALGEIQRMVADIRSAISGKIDKDQEEG